MRPKVKYAVIHRHRNEYPVSVMCKFFEVSRSGYYDFVKRLGRPESDADLAKRIEECQNRTDKTYGYRRVWKWLKDRNIKRNPKTVLRVMKKYGLLSEIRRRRKWVNLGQQVHKYKNHLNRQFWADRPNSKWVTDISYIHTKEGVLYLSMIRDLYDNSIVAYKTATQQTVNLVLDTIRLAMKKEKKRVTAELQLHSDQGFQYTSQAYFKLTQSYEIMPSMSSKGNPYDNAMAATRIMAGQIRISPEQMMSRVAEYRTQGDNVGEVITALDNLVNALDAEWEGAGKESYITRYQQLRNSFVAAEQLIKEIAVALTNTANFYAQADASVQF